MAEETSRRVQRVEKQIREILGTHLIREFQHHVEGLITISNVRVSPDLKHGRIYLRVLGPSAAQSKIQQSELFDELKERHSELQRFLGKSLGTKYCPKLEFFYDDTLEEVLKVEKTLKMLAEERKALGLVDETTEATETTEE
jgi:ribosome-binding factor A